MKPPCATVCLATCGCDLEAEATAPRTCDQAADQPQIARREIGADPVRRDRCRMPARRRLHPAVRVEQLDELRMNVGRRGRIVDGEKIDALSAVAVERDHQAEKIRIGLQMRAAEAGRDRPTPVYCAPGTNSADADEMRRQVLLRPAAAPCRRRPGIDAPPGRAPRRRDELATKLLLDRCRSGRRRRRCAPRSAALGRNGVAISCSSGWRILR